MKSNYNIARAVCVFVSLSFLAWHFQIIDINTINVPILGSISLIDRRGIEILVFSILVLFFWMIFEWLRLKKSDRENGLNQFDFMISSIPAVIAIYYSCEILAGNFFLFELKPIRLLVILISLFISAALFAYGLNTLRGIRKSVAIDKTAPIAPQLFFVAITFIAIALCITTYVFSKVLLDENLSRLYWLWALLIIIAVLIGSFVKLTNSQINTVADFNPLYVVVNHLQPLPKNQESERVSDDCYDPVESYNTLKQKLELGLDPDERINHGWTHLMKASAEDDINTVNLFLEYGCDPNITNHRGRTAIYYASRYGFDDIVKALIQNGADVNLIGVLETSQPLHVAVHNNHISTVKILLDAGADPKSVNGEGKNSIEIAQENKNGEMAKILRQARKNRTN